MYKHFMVTVILVIIFISFVYYFFILQRKSLLIPQLPVLITEEELKTTSSVTLTSTPSLDNSLIKQQRTSSVSETELFKATFTTSSL